MDRENMLICKQCGGEFVFTQEQRELYEAMGFEHAPRRCERCTMVKLALQIPEKPKKEMFAAVCADCGVQTQVPFRPTGNKPVYCGDCLVRRKKEAAKAAARDEICKK